MSITSEVNRTEELTTDGVETEFDFSLLIHDDSEIQVWYEVTGGEYTQLTLDTHYTVVFTEDGGTVTTFGASSPYAAGKILIIRNIPLTQQTNWLYNDNHSEQQHQDDFDRSVMRDLQIQEQLDRSVKFSITSGTTDIEFPEPSAGEYIAWNDAGTALQNRAALTSLDYTVGNFIVGDGSNWIVESGATARASLGLTIGTDVLAQQTIGIADDNLLEVDGTPNSGEYARFTAGGLEGRTIAEMVTDSGMLLADGTVALAGAWDMGNQNLTNVDMDTGNIDNAVINTEWDAAYDHVSNDGSDHGFIDQDVTSGSTPAFTATNITGVPAASILAGTFGTGAYVFDNTVSGITTLTAGSLMAGAVNITGNIINSTAGNLNITADGGNIFFDNDNIGMGSSSVNAGVFSMIQGAVGSDPTFAITQSGNDVTINQSIGNLTITAGSGEISFGNENLTTTGTMFMNTNSYCKSPNTSANFFLQAGTLNSGASLVIKTVDTFRFLVGYDGTSLLRIYNYGTARAEMTFPNAGGVGITDLLTATGGIVSGSNVISDTASTDDLGSLVVPWLNLFVDDITKSGRFHPNDNGVSSDGLILYLPMHGNADDYSGNGNDGTISGTPATVAGKFGSALDFDSTTPDYITILDSLSMDANYITVLVWIKTSAFDSDIGRKWGGAGTREWTINIDINNQAVFSISTDGTAIYSAVDVSGTVSVSDGELHLLMGTYDGETVKIYVDGLLKEVNTIPSGNLWNNANNINIGGPAYIRNNAFDGILSTFKIYNRALSLEEGVSYYEANRELVAQEASIGIVYGEIFAHAAAAGITSVAQNDWDQIVAFDTDGESSSATPDHTNDHIAIGRTGKYLVGFHWCGHGPATAHDWAFHVAANNRGTTFNNVTAHFTSPSTQKDTSVSAAGILDLTAGDTIELWVLRTSAGNNIVLTTENCDITLTQIGR